MAAFYTVDQVWRGLTCEGCGTKRPRLHKHHVKPRHLGGTFADGKKLLCANCHEDEHLELTPGQASRAAQRRTTRESAVPKELLERLYVEEGLTMRQIAAQIGTSFSNIQFWIVDYGIPRKRCGGTVSKRPLKQGLVSALHRFGSQTAVAEEYGVTSSAVSSWCKQYDIVGEVDGRKRS